MSQTLARRLRLITILDAGNARGRGLRDLGEELIQAGAPTVQVRAKDMSARELFELTQPLVPLARRHGCLLFVNDRTDVALATGAHGVHVGPDDLPVPAIRTGVPDDFLIGASTDDPREAVRLVEEGASYIGCGTVYKTRNKSSAGNVIGGRGLAQVVEAVEIPVVAIGGITVDRVPEAMGSGCAGVAVIGAVMGAPSAARAVRDLLDRLDAAR